MFLFIGIGFMRSVNRFVMYLWFTIDEPLFLVVSKVGQEKFKFFLFKVCRNYFIKPKTLWSVFCNKFDLLTLFIRFLHIMVPKTAYMTKVDNSLLSNFGFLGSYAQKISQNCAYVYFSCIDWQICWTTTPKYSHWQLVTSIPFIWIIELKLVIKIQIKCLLKFYSACSHKRVILLSLFLIRMHTIVLF